MKSVGVVINGAQGKMGREIARAMVADPGLKLLGAVEQEVTQRYFPVAELPWLIPFSSDLGWIIKTCSPDVVVDFTNAEAALAAARLALNRKVNMVIGSTGLTEENLSEIESLAERNGVGAIVAPNFSLAAALVVHLARFAAKFFDHAEIVEMHHDKKTDAPSGTAMATARAMAEAHGKPFVHPEAELEALSNTRGGELGGIAIHSLRMPGFLAGQEVVFSETGETLVLRHEAISRECYVPGVVLAIKEVVKHKGFVYGLDNLLNLLEL